MKNYIKLLVFFMISSLSQQIICSATEIDSKYQAEDNNDTNYSVSNSKQPDSGQATDKTDRPSVIAVKGQQAIDPNQKVAEKEDLKALLFDAVERNQEELILPLIKKNAPLNAVDKDGNTPLMRAAELGLRKIVFYLAKAGGYRVCTLKNGQGDTALHLAARNGQVDVVAVLISAGASIDVQNQAGDTPLICAAEHGHSQVLELIISRLDEIDPKIVGDRQYNYRKDGTTALMAAVEKNREDAVKLLIDSGANVNLQRQSGPLNGWTALMLTARAGQHKLMSMLLDAGAQPDLVESNRNTALIIAASRGFDYLVAPLAKKSNALNAQNNKGLTALMVAAQKGHLKVVRELLTAGAHINEQNRHGLTALMFAIGRKRHAVLEVLIQAHADVNIQTKKQETALMFAAMSGDKVIVEQLIKAGAEVNTKNSDGMTALMHAAQNGHAEVIEQLLAAKADVQAQAENGNTALMFACQKGHGAVAQLLLKSGAQVDTRNQSTLTALMLAAQEDKADAIDVLLQADATVNLQNDAGNSALMLAAFRSKNAVKVLIPSANLNLRNQGRLTALEIAESQNQIAIMRLLLAEYDLELAQLLSQPAPPPGGGQIAAGLGIGKFDKWQQLKSRKLIRNKLNGWHDRLFYEIITRNYDQVCNLITRMEDIGVFNQAGDNPLHVVLRNIKNIPDSQLPTKEIAKADIAAYQTDKKILCLLLSICPQLIMYANKDGQKPLDLVVGKPHIMKLLVQAAFVDHKPKATAAVSVLTASSASVAHSTALIWGSDTALSADGKYAAAKK